MTGLPTGALTSTNSSPDGGQPDWLTSLISTVLRQKLPTMIIAAGTSSTYFNEACRSIALSPTAIQGAPLDEVSSSMMRLLENVLDAGWAGDASTARNLNLTVEGPEGVRDVWLEVSVSPINVSQRVAALLCILQDVTEEHVFEERAKAAEARAAAVTELIPAFLWRVDPRGTVRWMNDRFQTYLGVGLQEARDNGWAGWLHPSDRDRILAEWGLSVASGSPFEQNHRFRNASGGFAWFATRVLPQFDSAGTLIGWHGAAVPMADHAANPSPTDRQILWVADPTDWSMRFLNVDPASGWPTRDISEAVPWETHLSAVHEEDRSSVQSAFEMLVGGQAADAVYRVRTRSGDVLAIEEAGFPMREPDGDISRIVGMSRIRTVTPAEITIIDPGTRCGTLRLALEREGYRIRIIKSLSAAAKARGLVSGVIYCSSSTVADILHATDALRRELPGIPLIVMGDPTATPREIFALHNAGVADILSYDAPDAENALTIQKFLDSVHDVSDLSTPSDDTKDRLGRLTSREREILELAVAGGTSKTIGRALNLSPRTVEHHRSKALDKLGVNSVAHAAPLVLP